MKITIDQCNDLRKLYVSSCQLASLIDAYKEQNAAEHTRNVRMLMAIDSMIIWIVRIIGPLYDDVVPRPSLFRKINAVWIDPKLPKV